jgi:hypothetical protein
MLIFTPERWKNWKSMESTLLLTEKLLGFVLGDNLGLNEILGFVQSFNANYSCRFCKIQKDQLKVCCKEDNSMRYKQTYMMTLLLQEMLH